MRIHFVVFFLSLILISILTGCGGMKNSVVSLQADYLGMKPPADTPVRFAPGIVASMHHEHSRLEFSKDGLELYWNIIPVDTNYRSRSGRPFRPDKSNIWFTRRTNTGWTDAAIFPLTLESGAGSPTFSPDGSIFYYQSNDPNADPDERPKPNLLYATKKVNGNWKEAYQVKEILPKEKNRGTMSFCFADNGNLYFDYGGPAADGNWWWNIRFSEFKDGKYKQPVVLDFGINDGDVDWCPWIAPDESYMIWSSHREENYGNGDLFISFKNDDGTWDIPVNMGESVNTNKQERFPSVSPDGKYLFFARHEPETYSDIFWVDASIIESLKESQMKN